MTFNSDQFTTKYARTQTATAHKLFYLSLFDFVRELEKHPYIQQIMTAIKHEAEKDRYNYGCKTIEAQDHLKSIWGAYESYCNAKNIALIPLSFFEGGTYFDEGPTQSTADIVSNSDSVLIDRLSALIQQDAFHISFVSQFFTVSCHVAPIYYSDNTSPHNISDIFYKIQSTPVQRITIEHKSNIINDYLVEEERLKKISPTTIWYHWDTIIWLNNIYIKEQETLGAVSCLERIAISAFSALLTNIITSNRTTSTPLNENEITLDDLKYSLQKIMSFIQETGTTIALPEETDQSIEGNYPQYDQAIGDLLLTRGSKPILIDGESFEGKILGLFFPNGTPDMQLRMHWDALDQDISPDLTKNAPPNKKRSRVYNSVTRIHKKAGKELLLKRKGFFYLNPNS